ncbi:helix-turn-helix transcriptional regulator [Belnapia sp. T6]|uniref:Helix-turn-helix transcriptional regulator n=1 Tax=Belnapia mucosa TaxID=2804532 RepID=A0ABS1V328_9PROT|nr:helix-turn-helix transcriptional regulator [Belnapia mucosa]MBL6456080.1 helix-turn-helix transcriptional regulator [Belnapia mucosa]
MAAATLLDRPRRAAPAGLAVALRSADPDELAGRLASLPGLRLVEEETEAAVVVSDAPPGMPAAEGPPVLLLAEGAAALAAVRAGARAVLPPDAPPAQLAAALPAAARGLAVLPPALLAGLLGPQAARDARAAAPVEAGLTRREREVLDLLAAGASNKVIARRLNLSFHTAKAHVAAVMQKLGAGSRADAVARGARAGLVLL